MKPTSLPPPLANVPKKSLILGLLALILCMVGGLLNPPRFFESYLAAYLFFLGVTLGSSAMLMVHQLVGGSWGKLIRRFQEAASASLPLMALLFVPVLFGLPELYPWADPQHAADPIIQARKPYMNVAFFIVRAAGYFAVWIVWGLLLRMWGLRYEQTADPKYYNRLQRLSAAGLVVYVLTVSFAAMDWVMSRDSHWYSTIIGFILVTGQALSALALTVILLSLVARYEPFAGTATRQDFNDLGNILLTLVILFSYVSFVQFLIQWYGHTQEDIVYYVPRTQGGWAWAGAMLILFHFALPFFLLLVRFNKRHIRILSMICLLILAMRVVDNLWLVLPSSSGPTPDLGIHWTVLAALVGIGGVWMAFFLWKLGTGSLLPARDPAMAGEEP